MTVSTADSTVPSKLPVWWTVKSGYHRLYSDFSAFLTAAAVPAALSTLLAALVADKDLGIVITLVRIVLDTLLVVLFQLAWFRVLMLGPAASWPRLLPRPDKRLLPFMLYATLLVVFFLPALFALHGLDETAATSLVTYVVVVVLLYLAAAYLNLRFSLIYLWIAVDLPGRLGQSWRTTKGNGMRLVFALILVASPLILLLLGAGYLAAMFAPHDFEELVFGNPDGWLLWFGLLLEQTINYLFYGLSCTVLVQAFRHLTGWNNDQQEILERFE